MKLKYNFLINEIADKKVAVAVGEDINHFNGFIKMNDESAFIFEQLKNDVSEDDIAAALVAEFGAEDNEELRVGIRGFIAGLEKEGVIE